jgi:hypothetical protein
MTLDLIDDIVTIFGISIKLVYLFTNHSIVISLAHKQMYRGFTCKEKQGIKFHIKYGFHYVVGIVDGPLII